MFFDLILLQRQGRGQLSVTWKVATLGVKSIKNSDVEAANIVYLCDEVSKYIDSESSTPTQRFSLRLSSILLNGIIKLHNQKATIYLEDIYKLWSTVNVPRPINSIQLILESPPSPIVRRRMKRRRKVVDNDTPEEDVRRISDMLVKGKFKLPPMPKGTNTQARLEDITMREVPRMEEDVGGIRAFLRQLTASQDDQIEPDKSKRSRHDVEMEIDEVEEHGLAPTISRPRVTVYDILSPLVTEVNPPQVDSSMEETIVAREKIVVAAQVHASADTLIDVVAAAQQQIPATNFDGDKIDQPAPRQIQSAQQTELPKEKPKLQPPRKDVPPISHHQARQARDVTRDNFELVLNTRKFVRIDVESLSLIKDINKYDMPLPEGCLHVTREDVKPFLDRYLTGLSDFMIDIHRQGESVVEVQNSQVLSKNSGEGTPVEVSSVDAGPVSMRIPSIAVSEVSPSIPIDSQIDSHYSQMGVLLPPPLPGDTSTPKHTRSKRQAQSKTLQDIAESPEMKSQRLHLNEPVTRHQLIVDKVVGSADRLTPEELCGPPLTKLRMARTFNDLLALSKAQYVTLISEPDSIELKYVAKGPKLPEF